MSRLMLLPLLFASNFAMASSFLPKEPLTLDLMALKVTKFTCNRDPQIPELECSDWRGRVAAQFDLGLLKYGFWRNDVHAEGTEAKFMTVGWHWELGAKLGKQVELIYEHHSRHTMDKEQPYSWTPDTDYLRQNKYPVEDSFGVRIIFYKRK